MPTETIVILVVTFVFVIVVTIVARKFVGNAMGDKKVLATGTPGQAVVMNVSPTGMVVNDFYHQCNIGLRVTLPGKAPYDVVIKQLVAITSMAALTPGTTVGVKVDPADQTKAVIDWNVGVVPPGMAVPATMADPSAGDLAAAVAVASSQGGAAGLEAAGVEVGSAAALLRTGQRVLGVVTEFADTGNTARSLGVTPSRPEFIDDPMYIVTLQLHIPNLAPVEGKVMHRVPRAQVPNLVLGLQLNCAVNPANPTRDVAIDWGDIPV